MFHGRHTRSSSPEASSAARRASTLKRGRDPLETSGQFTAATSWPAAAFAPARPSAPQPPPAKSPRSRPVEFRRRSSPPSTPATSASTCASQEFLGRPHRLAATASAEHPAMRELAMQVGLRGKRSLGQRVTEDRQGGSRGSPAFSGLTRPACRWCSECRIGAESGGARCRTVSKRWAGKQENLRGF